MKVRTYLQSLLTMTAKVGVIAKPAKPFRQVAPEGGDSFLAHRIVQLAYALFLVI